MLALAVGRVPSLLRFGLGLKLSPTLPWGAFAANAGEMFGQMTRQQIAYEDKFCLMYITMSCYNQCKFSGAAFTKGIFESLLLRQLGRHFETFWRIESILECTELTA